jgi:hypothetical protein
MPQIYKLHFYEFCVDTKMLYGVQFVILEVNKYKTVQYQELI